MMAKWSTVSALSLFLIISFSSLPAQNQAAPDYGKILGTWDVEVNADGEFYYLTMNIEKSEEGLKGTVSESTGAFSDVPLKEIQYDGQSLKFQFTSPTPPDGLERLVKADFKIGDNKLEGTMAVEDMGISVPATATKKVK
jgi:DNA-binding beta-propeller fold protein YncE